MMKTRSIITLTLLCVLAAACKNANETCYSTPTTAPINTINLKFISKTTGADLIFGPGAPYKFSDLQVTGNQPHLYVDSANKNNPFIFLLVEGEMTQNVILKLSTLPADTISAIFTTTQKSPCYSYTSLSTINLDGKTVCSNCSTAVQTVTIAK